jgi:polyphenol oxidase
MLRVPGWEKLDGLVHGFFGRKGGSSEGTYASLNLSSRVGDHPAAVAQNRILVEQAAKGLKLVGMRQVHGTESVRVSEPRQTVGSADGMFTTVEGLGLAVLTADCVPVLMVVPTARVAVAVHAGWRGTAAGVVPAAVRAVCGELGLNPGDLKVALGPAIGACCYEVERAIGEELTDRWGAMPEAWHPDGSHGRLDLRAANRAMLVGVGVPADRIELVGSCTSCEPERFFSHRRSGGCTGRQISFVGWC